MKREAVLKFAIGLIALVALAPAAWAVPAINGTIAAGEWDGSAIVEVDPNEGTIPDAYDIGVVRYFQETSGGGDGLYVLIDVIGVPTFTPAPPGFGPVVYGTLADFTGDGLFTSASDRVITFTSSGFVVKDGTGSTIADTGTASALGADGVEYFIPVAMLPGGALPLGFSTGFLSFLDNGGSPPDDFVPDVGLSHIVPEPASAALLFLGLGLFGFGGRRKFLNV